MSGPLTALYARLTRSPQVLRFGFVAVIGLVVDLTIAYGASRLLGVPLVLAAGLGFACGACVNYALHELWTFQAGAQRLSLRRALKYALSLGATLAVRLGAVAGLERLMAEGQELAVLTLATGVSFGVNYLTSKFMVFHPALRTGTTDEGATDEADGKR